MKRIIASVLPLLSVTHEAHHCFSASTAFSYSWSASLLQCLHCLQLLMKRITASVLPLPSVTHEAHHCFSAWTAFSYSWSASLLQCFHCLPFNCNKTFFDLHKTQFNNNWQLGSDWMQNFHTCPGFEFRPDTTWCFLLNDGKIGFVADNNLVNKKQLNNDIRIISWTK